MPDHAAPLDRRSAIKARHRRAILDSAAALIAESGRFSADQLAERADVARRTVFNHFASVDEIVTTICVERLEVVIETFRGSATRGRSDAGTRSAMFEDVAQALRETDVPGVVSLLYRALGGFAAGDPRPMQIFQTSFARTADDLADELTRRNPQADALDAELLVAFLMHGAGVIANRWIALTGATTDDDARALWDDLLERLLASLRAGFAPRH